MSGEADFFLGPEVGTRDRLIQDQIWSKLRADTAALYGGAYRDKLSALAAVQGGVRGANRIVNRAGTGIIRRGASDYRAGAAAENASLSDRGLSSSAGSGGGDLARARQTIGAGLASLRAGVDMRGASALANEYNSMAGLRTTYMGQLARMSADQQTAYNQIPTGRAGGYLKFATSVGGLIGGFFGGSSSSGGKS